MSAPVPMSRLQNEALALISYLYKGASIECEKLDHLLICQVAGEEGKWRIDREASFIREPSGRITDLAELDVLVRYPDTFAARPEYDPPDDEYEAEFTGRSVYRASTASDDYGMATGMDDDAWSFAEIERRDAA